MKRIEIDPDFAVPTRREAIHGYIESFTLRDTLHAEHIADSINQKTTPLADYVVLIPVAAHQEAEQIQPALAEYARQQGHTPFSVVLGLNSPFSEVDNPQIDATIAAIEKAKKQYPHLDIRDSMTYYEKPVIGEIRRDLWNGALLSAMDSGTYLYDDDEMIGINHDIDLISMSPRYIQRVQNYYTGRRRAYTNAGMAPIPFSPRATLLKHAPSPDHPNISKGAYWMDFMTRQLNGPYEASLIVPFSHYADRGGFRTSATTHETSSLFKSMASQSLYIPGTTMQTSPRRYVDRLQYGYANIWTDNTFGAHDNCRTPSVSTDITMPRLEKIIQNDSSIAETISRISSMAINRYIVTHDSALYDEEMTDKEFLSGMNKIITNKLNLAQNVLTRVIQSESLSKEALNLERDIEYRAGILSSHFSLPDSSKE